MSVGVISINEKGVAQVANARLDTMSREVLRHEEFSELVTLQRVRDHFICTYACMYVCPYVHACVHLYMYVYIYACIYVCIYLFLCMYASVETPNPRRKFTPRTITRTYSRRQSAPLITL